MESKDGDEHRLAYELDVVGFMKGFEEKSTPTGGYTIAHVPDTAAETLADGQFTRFTSLLSADALLRRTERK